MVRNIFDKIGSVGTVVAGMASPCCFPFLGLAGSALGLAFLSQFEDWVPLAIQGLVLVALVGNFIAYRTHRKVAPLILAIASTAAVIYGVNTRLDTNYIYGGMLGLLIVAAWNSFESRRCAADAARCEV